MGQMLSKNLTYSSKVRTPDLKKSAATLTTGQIAYIEADVGENNQNGNNNGVQQFSLYLMSADRVTRSAAVSFSYSDQDGRTSPFLPRGSMCIDAQNNIHFAYVYSAGSGEQQRTAYRKATYTAGTYIWSTEQVISAYVANRYHLAIDIDMPGSSTDYPVVAVTYRTGTSSYVCNTVLYNKQSSGGTWVSQQITTTTVKLNTPDLSLACRITTDGTANALPTYVLSYNPGNIPAGLADTGDVVYTGRLTIGGAISTAITIAFTGINAGLNGGYRNYWVFSLTADYYLVYGEVQTDPNIYWWSIIQVSGQNGTPTNVVVPARTGTHSSYKMTRPAYALGAASLYRLGNGDYALASYTLGTDSPIRSDIYLNINGGVWTYREPSGSRLANAGLFKSATIAMVYGADASRYANSQSPFCFVHYTYTGTTYVYKSYAYTRSHMQVVQAISDPSESQIESTNKISATVQVIYPAQASDQNQPTYDARVQVQLSTAVNFSTNLYTATQDISQELTYASTAVGVSLNLAAFPLTQTTWYMRGRMIDSLGMVSAWSDTRTFRVSHPAVPTNTQPADQGAVAYFLGISTFSWDFSDAYPDDTQRAFRIEVLNSASKASLFDSGKVVSSLKYSNIDLGAGNLETNIDWYLTLWDAEDVPGPRTFNGSVLFTTNPSPTITSPAVDATLITTAQPGISWTPGTGGSKTQYSFRVLIRNYIDQTLVFDSGMQISTDTSYNIPSGYLHNGGSYKLDLMIQDSVGLGATVSRTFTTGWTTPASLNSPVVYPDRHNTVGYVAVACDMLNLDSTYDHATLYRRSLDRENAGWEAIYATLEATSFVYLDYLCPMGVLSEYMVTQTASRFGDYVESDPRTSKRVQYAPKETTFWLIDSVDPTRSVLLPNVTTHSYTDEYEKSDYTVIGAGRQIEEGEHIGINGTLDSQIRTRYNDLGGTDNYNLLTNTNLLMGQDANLIGAALVNAGAQQATPAINEVNGIPGPGNRGKKKLGITVSKTTASSNQVTSGIQIPVPMSPYMTFQAGKQYHLSGWFNIPSVVSGYEVRLRISWNLAGASQSVEQVVLSSDLSNSATAIDSRLYGTDLWLRLGKTVTVPSNVDSAVMSILIVSSGTTVLPPVTVFAEGLQLTIGANPIGFFNGSHKSSSVWTGVENFDPSYTPGFVSPRFVKQNIEALRRSGHDLYIRTPFGDVWEVYVNDLSLSNVAGTGQSEFVDLTLPYLQIGNS